MARVIRIKTSQMEAVAELNDTRTAQAVWKALPIKGQVSLWGDEIYFPIPLSLGLEAGHELVKTGEWGYWLEGNAFCIFFGPTPISQTGEIRAASPVTVFGRVTSDTELFKHVAAGTDIIIERKEETKHKA